MSDVSSAGMARRTGKNPGPRTGLRSRQKARARHVPVTRRVAAWIAAIAHDPATARNFVIAFALVHAMLWTVILTALKGAQDIPADVAEVYAWGRKFLLGYGAHPPLPGWIAGLWFRVFPATDWAAYALAMATVGCALVLCWLIAVRVVDHRRAMFTVAMLALYPVFNLKGFRFTPDLLQLVTLPLTVLAYLHAFRARTWRAGVWLGLAAAAALMTDERALIMIGAIGLAALVHPQRVRFLATPAPWTAVATCAVAMLPHLVWLQRMGLSPLVNVGDAGVARNFADAARLAAGYVGHNIAMLLVPVACAAVALAWKLQWWKSIRARGVRREIAASARRPWARGRNSGVDSAQALNVWTIQGAVAVVPPLVALAFGIAMKKDWGIPLFFLAPLALVAIPALRVTQMALIRLMLMWLAVTLAMLALSPIIAAQTVRRDGVAGLRFYPKSEVALQLTEAWRARFNSRWAVVAGAPGVNRSMAFYSPDHPAPLTPGEVPPSGLTTLDEATRRGFIGICDAHDARLPDCEAWMTRTAPDAERVDLTSRRYFHGRAGPAARWKVWIARPAQTDDDDDK